MSAFDLGYTIDRSVGLLTRVVYLYILIYIDILHGLGLIFTFQ